MGLSRAGTSNTAKVVSYNTILGVISFFAHGAIRQFCVFAIVVLVAHWFLIHTFFVAVLSIDIQRLEVNQSIASLQPCAHIVASLEICFDRMSLSVLRGKEPTALSQNRTRRQVLLGELYSGCADWRTGGSLGMSASCL